MLDWKKARLDLRDKYQPEVLKDSPLKNKLKKVDSKRQEVKASKILKTWSDSESEDEGEESDDSEEKADESETKSKKKKARKAYTQYDAYSDLLMEVFF